MLLLYLSMFFFGGGGHEVAMVSKIQIRIVNLNLILMPNLGCLL